MSHITSKKNQLLSIPILLLFVMMTFIEQYAMAAVTKLPEPIRDVLIDYCYDCHGEGQRKGKVDFDIDDQKLLANKHLWAKAWENLLSETMPPPKKDQPPQQQKVELMRFIEGQIFKLNPEKPDPGRVTIRRLNQREYRNTIKDLFEIDYRTDEHFLPDDTGYGFDNIGDVLSLSPDQMEKYFNAAEWIVDQILDTARLRTHENWVQNYKTSTEGTVQKRTGKVWAPHDGVYDIDIRVLMGSFYQFHGFVPVTIKLGDKVLVDSKWRHDGKKDGKNKSIKGYQGKQFFKAGEYPFEISYDLTVGKSEKDRPKIKFSFQLEHAKLIGPVKPLRQYRAKEHRKVFFEGLPETHEATLSRPEQIAYARRILTRLADRAFRRPAGKKTIDRLMSLVTSNLDELGFEKAVGEGILGMLVSPRFLFRSEFQPKPDDPRHIHQLDDHALAARLSYFLWSSLPDERLKKIADEGRMKEELNKQVKRMMKDKRFRRFSDTFVGQWLQVDNVQGIRFDRRYEERIRRLRTAMRRETMDFFNYIVKEDRPLIEIINADYTFLNSSLAKHYGIKNVKGNDMRKVKLPPDSVRGGILSHGSYLAITSNPTKTSPVKRGLFVLENILDAPPPPAPAGIPELEEAKTESEFPTLRDKLAAHRASPVCASCHKRMDPIGLGLENFDPIGRWREKYPRSGHGGENENLSIIAHGELDTGDEFQNPIELKNLIAKRAKLFYRCLTKKVMTYALGRGIKIHDYPQIEKITNDVAKDPRFEVLLLGVVNSPQFKLRRGHGMQDELNLQQTH